MKLFAIICSLLVASQVQAKVGDIFNDLVTKALKIVAVDMLIHTQLPLPPIQPLIFQDSTIRTNITLLISKATVSKAGNFVVNKINIKPFSPPSELGLTFPTISLKGDFEVTGLILGLEVTGRGNFTGDITNLVVNGEIQTEILSGGILRVLNNSVSYTVQDAKVTQTGLKVEGMTDQQVHDFLSNTMTKLLQVNEPEISQKIAQRAVIDANQLINHSNFGDLLNAVKNFDDAGPNCSDLVKSELRFHSIYSTSPEILSSRLISDLSKLLKEKQSF